MNDPLKYVELYNRCEAEGIHPWFSFIFGSDKDTHESVWKTIEFLKKHKIWNIAFFILTPLPGSKIYEEMLSAGRIIDFNWSKYDVAHVVYQPANFTAPEMHDTYWQLYRSMYSMRSVLLRSLHTLKTRKLLALVNSLVVQYYFRMQVFKYNHPYNMGINKHRKAKIGPD